MTADHAPLPLSFYSIIIKRQAVARSFPGGFSAFELIHRPRGKSPALYLLSRTTVDALHGTLGVLEAAGIIAGQDLAVADVFSGPHLECPEVTFYSEGVLPGRRWVVMPGPELESYPAGDEPWAIPTTFFATVIRRDGIDRAYRGGMAEFTRRYRPAHGNGQLVLWIGVQKGPR